MVTVSVCPKCGTIGKSGKRSCCGRGGSWFKNCGDTGSTKLHFTWYEGIQTCTAPSQSTALIGLQLNGARQQDTHSLQEDDVSKDKLVAANGANTFEFHVSQHFGTDASYNVSC